MSCVWIVHQFSHEVRDRRECSRCGKRRLTTRTIISSPVLPMNEEWFLCNDCLCEVNHEEDEC